jgi:hypothetical protein
MSFGRRSIENPFSQPGDAARLPAHETPFLSVVGPGKALPVKEELVPIVRSRIPG